MPWLLDTNVLSETIRPRPNPGVIRFLTGAPLHDLFTSTVNLAEIRFGIASVPDATRSQELQRWLENDLRINFAGRILDLTEDILFRWRTMLEEGRKSGRTPSQPDLMIAATALEHDLTLVTRNVKDFAGLGIVVLNPWDDPPSGPAE